MINGFFDQYPEFYKTSKTTPFPNRLNNRYLALIDFNKKIIQNSLVLDLASHDGRWSFAAIKNGASKVLGIEGRKELVQNCHRNMEKYGISQEKYSFILGDVFEEIHKVKSDSVDIVFCFGFFYHIMDHMHLLGEITRLCPKYLILDTSISSSDKPIIEIREEDSEKEMNAIKSTLTESKKVLVGYPSKSSLELMLTNLGYSFYYYNWHNIGIENWEYIGDYKENLRVSLVARLER